MFRLVLLLLSLCLFLCAQGGVWAQCAACVIDPDCVSSDGFPTLCPAELPAGIAGEEYEAFITFYIPAEVTDPGSGLVATLLGVEVTSVTGLPPGIEIELDDADGLYEPASGQTSGCATLCGVPTFPGVFNLQISITAVVSALGFEQEVVDGFSYTLIVEPGAGGTSSFTYSPAAGCGEVVADFSATVFGEGNQWTTHTWTLPDGVQVEGVTLEGVGFPDPGPNPVSLETVILDQVLQEVYLNGTGGGGWDDFFGNPDPYFTIKDANDNVVYTSGTVDDVGSASWTGLNIILNNPPYALDFYDEDLFDGDDWLGWSPFTPNGPGAIDFNASPSFGQLVIGLQPLVTIVDVAEVEVFALPEMEIALSGDGALQCSPDSLLQYNWYLGDSLVAEGTEAQWSPGVSGWYSVVGLDSNGCSAGSDSVLFCLPDAAMDLALIELNGTPMGLEADADHPWWAWYFNGNLVDTLFGGGQVWFPLESGWYRVESVTADLGCPVASDSVLVCWPIAPPMVYQDDMGNLLVDGEYEGYQWWFEGSVLDGEEGPVLASPGEGSYTVWVTDFIDCPAVASSAVVYVGVEEYLRLEAGLYPNPFEGRFRLTLGEGWLGGRAELLDPSGRVIDYRVLRSTVLEWDGRALSSGRYLMRLTTSDGGAGVARVLIKP